MNRNDGGEICQERDYHNIAWGDDHLFSKEILCMLAILRCSSA